MEKQLWFLLDQVLTLRSDPWAGLIASCGSFLPMVQASIFCIFWYLLLSFHYYLVFIIILSSFFFILESWLSVSLGNNIFMKSSSQNSEPIFLIQEKIIFKNLETIKLQKWEIHAYKIINDELRSTDLWIPFPYLLYY